MIHYPNGRCQGFVTIQSSIETLIVTAESFDSQIIAGLLRSAPDLSPNIDHINSLYTIEHGMLAISSTVRFADLPSGEKTIAILPTKGANEECDEADAEVDRIEAALNELLETALSGLRRAICAKSFEANDHCVIELRICHFGTVHRVVRRFSSFKYPRASRHRQDGSDRLIPRYAMSQPDRYLLISFLVRPTIGSIRQRVPH